MTAQDQIKALAELDGFLYVKVIGEPELTHWQISKDQKKDGTLSPGTPWAVNYIVRNKPDDGDNVVDFRLVPKYLHSYDAIIPLAQKVGLLVTIDKNTTPAEVAEIVLRATGKWK